MMTPQNLDGEVAAEAANGVRHAIGPTLAGNGSKN